MYTSNELLEIINQYLSKLSYDRKPAKPIRTH